LQGKKSSYFAGILLGDKSSTKVSEIA